MLEAHWCANKTLEIIKRDGANRAIVAQYGNIGKREARKLAVALGATPWNF